MSAAHQKVTAGHLSRDAYLYVRQSTLRQVFEHAESTRRQYGLREHAVALGWSTESVVVIDSDLGQSGADSDREGFQRLVAEVGMGRAGIVLGLEVSRLARNSTDWHRLLEICALSETLILDEDGVYDPVDFNDRLLLGLKGTMSEAELHVMRARMQGGVLNAAKRGELKIPLPVGLVYDPLGNVVLDPDEQVRHSLRLLFKTFTRTGSARATVKHFRQEKLRVPHRPGSGPRKGELHWKLPTAARVARALHNPRYAGAFAFGRTRTRRRPGGGVEYRSLPRKEWKVLILDAHPGYITWERFEQNERQLLDNALAFGLERRGAPREGPALLQGLAICSVCGRSMGVRYRTRKAGQAPYYLCNHEGNRTASDWCQSIPGAPIDRAVGELLVELMTPLTLEAALQVQDELAARAGEADQWRAQQVQRAREEANLARQRFMQTHPDNRMVVDVLEAEWNAKLRALHEAQSELERHRAEPAETGLDERQRRRILALATDFQRLWNDPATPNRERKRMARLLIEDVTLTKATSSLGVRLRGGATRQLTWVPDPHTSEVYKTRTEVVAQVDRLLEEHTDSEIAAILNEHGYRSGYGHAFNPKLVFTVRRNYALKPLYARLRERGWLRREEVAERLGVSISTVKKWHRHGLLRSRAYNDKPNNLYKIPDPPPTKKSGGGQSQGTPICRPVPQRNNEGAV